MEIKDSVAMITGGASGLGAACAQALVARGGKVALLDLSEENGRKMQAELGPAAIFCLADVCDEASVSQAVAATIEAFGQVNLAINCAGVAFASKVLGKHGPMSLDHFRKVVEINLIGTMNLIRLAAEQMVKNEPGPDGEKGVVINTASVAAFEGQVGQAAYAASKAGVVGLTLPVAREFASYGIRVMTIAPGIFDTPMMASLPEKVRDSLGQMVPFPSRLGRPEEFASLALEIITNPVLNGEVIRLDGAIRMAAR
ncbi:MAG: 3-hydroxyacyl-CoA dehydrogenase [Deltaproteobacteria bacterium]|nr:3-hydroxyacyl-CoA dehydrogenase [Deltaproteobacteria bacterium]